MAAHGRSRRLPFSVLCGVGLALLLSVLVLLSHGGGGGHDARGGRLLRALAPAAAPAAAAAAPADDAAHPPDEGAAAAGAGAEAHDDAHGAAAAGGGHGDGGHAEGGKHGHESIFMEALSLDQTKVGIMMASVIVAQLLLDATLHRVETSVGQASKMLIAEIYKELATLGIISFILFLVTSFATDMDVSLLHAFEYAHLLIFGLAICYIIQSGLLISSIKPIKRQLIKQNALANDATTTTSPVSMGYWGFQVFRNKFIQLRKLPPSFLYDRYLIEIYNRWIEMKLEISTWCWAFIVGIFLLHIFVSMSPSLSSFFLHPASFVVYGWIIFAMDLAIYLVVRRAHMRVLAKLRGDLEEKQATSFALHKQYSERHNALEMVKVRRVEIFNAMEASKAANHSGSTHGSKKLDDAAADSVPKGDSNDTTSDDTPAPALGSSSGHGSAHGSSSKRLGASGDSHGSGSGGILRHHHHELTYDDSDEDPHAVHPYGFLPWESTVFDKGSQLLSISRCLYMATFLVAYLIPSYKTYATWQAVLLTVIIPLPAILAAIYIIPRMVTRYLLVRSLSSVDLNALDSVVEYMETVAESFETISHLLTKLQANQGVTLEKIFRDFDTDGSGSLDYTELNTALRKNDIHLKRKHFKALVRFVDADLNGDVNLEEFQGLLKGDHVFTMEGIMQKGSSTGSLGAAATAVPPAKEQQAADAVTDQAVGAGASQ